MTGSATAEHRMGERHPSGLSESQPGRVPKPRVDMSNPEPLASIRREKRVESYDFREPKLFSKEILSSLRSTHDLMARNLNRVFGSALRQRVDVDLETIDQLSTNALLEKLPSPSVIYLLTFQGLDGEIILSLPTEFCIFLIERQSGGRFSEFPNPRSLTLIEERIVDRVMEDVIREVRIAWEPSVKLELKKAVYEDKPENIDLITLDPSIVTRMSIELLGKRSEMVVSYQYSLLKEILSDFMINREKNDQKKRLNGEQLEAYKRTLKDVAVSVQALLGEARISMKEVLRLKEGDVVTLNQKLVDPLSVKVNGERKMEAYPGTVRGRKAVRILRMEDEIQEQDLL